nr:MAG TPA: hypothetical protein [Caudoviricetes sp.]
MKITFNTQLNQKYPKGYPQETILGPQGACKIT